MHVVNPDVSVEDILIDVVITDNAMFSGELLGGYTFDNYIGDLKMPTLFSLAFLQI